MAKYSQKVVLCGVRIVFPALFEPWKGKEGNNEPKYGVTILFEEGSPELAKLKGVIREAADAAWGKDPAKWPRKRDLAIRDGNEKAESWGEVFAGKKYVRASSNAKNPPKVVDERVQPVLEPEKVYSGCYANIQVHAYSYDANGNIGIGVSLDMLQFDHDGERLGFYEDPKDVFQAKEGVLTGAAREDDEFFNGSSAGAAEEDVF